MPNWYEVFDNEEVQWQTRKQATRLARLVVLSVVATTVLLAVGLTYRSIMVVAAIVVVAVWGVTAWWLARRMRAIRRVVWCVKISDRRVEAYDYSRKKISMDWTTVERVGLTENGLVLTGSGATSFEIPLLFTDFAALSHRIVHCADLYSVPIYIDGRPWQALDVYELFPFLVAGPSPGSAGTHENR